MPLNDELRLEDRARVSDVVFAYAAALDNRDWTLLSSILTDPVAIDYTSFDPDLDIEVPRSDWVARVEEGLSGFAVTQHLSTNHRFAFDGPDACTCISYMQALHVLREGGKESTCTLHGYYTNTLRGTDGRWLIGKCRLTITASLGDSSVFGRAVEKYRRGEQP